MYKRKSINEWKKQNNAEKGKTKFEKTQNCRNE